MSESIKIQVYTEHDGAKQPVADATVSLVPRAATQTDDAKKKWPYYELEATHEHSADGFYAPKSATPLDPGEYLLVVRKSGSSPVVQRLRLTAKRGVLEVTPGWDKQKGAAHQAATVSIVNVGPRATPSADEPLFATVNVLLLPRTELVGLACHNHFSRRTVGRDGTRYLPFAEGHRNLMYAAGKIDKATLATILDCQARVVRVSVKNAQPSRQGWVTIHEAWDHPLADDDGKRRPDETSEHEIGIEAFYDHIDAIGWVHPGTLVEAGIFGHGWVQGPIVWGTSDFSRGPERWPGGGGTPKDLDARQDDFLKVGHETPLGPAKGTMLMNRWPMLASAFAKGAALRLWGCVHMNNVLAQCRTAWTKIQAKTARDEFFDVALIDGGRERTTLDLVKCNVAQAIVSEVFGRPLEHGDCRGIVAYAGAAAQFLGKSITVFAAAPGMGSLYGNKSGDYIHLVGAGGENSGPFQWWKHEFPELELDDRNYLNYTKMLTAKLPDPGWQTQRHALIFDDDTELGSVSSFAVLRLPSGLEVFRPGSRIPAKTFERAVAHQHAGRSGHLYVVRRSSPSALLDRPPGKILLLAESSDHDTALMVDTEGRTTVLVAPKGSKPAAFTSPPATLPLEKIEYVWRNEWKRGAKIRDITDGVLEKVDPAWSW
ncbi:MAG: hypothetical protein KDK70_17050 [Myxococcales bacterium]|nr:hypothetical protein [Myxococcales bacterium]